MRVLIDREVVVRKRYDAILRVALTWKMVEILDLGVRMIASHPL
jgi:hypothetical protein